MVLRTDALFTVSQLASEPMIGGVLNPQGDRFIFAEHVESGGVGAPEGPTRVILVEHFLTELCERVGGC